MTRFLIAAAAATLTFAAPAIAGERTFVRDGVEYSYTSTVKGDAVVLEGTSSASGQFRFVVKNGWVNGYAGSSSVSFRTDKKTASVLQVASR